MGELISVVIPAYNVGPYLDNCLNSVLKQTYPDIEVLLVDDGSTDDTAKIADRFQAKYPSIFRVFHTDNRGVTMARFEGIRAARGEWIGFVDGDDEIEADMYKRLYTNAKQYYADISHCGHRTIVNGGERIHDFYNTGRFAQQDRPAGLKDLLAGSFEPSLCSKLFRKSLLQSLVHSDWMDPSIKFNEDLLMNYFLFREAQSSVYEDFCGYHYLAHSSSATRSEFRIEKILDPVKVRKQILDHTEQELIDIAWRKYLVACTVAYSILISQNGNESLIISLKTELKRNKDQWIRLSKTEQIKLILILAIPKMYNTLYQFYVTLIQEKRYE